MEKERKEEREGGVALEGAGWLQPGGTECTPAQLDNM